MGGRVCAGMVAGADPAAPQQTDEPGRGAGAQRRPALLGGRGDRSAGVARGPASEDGRRAGGGWALRRATARAAAGLRWAGRGDGWRRRKA